MNFHLGQMENLLSLGVPILKHIRVDAKHHANINTAMQTQTVQYKHIKYCAMWHILLNENIYSERQNT